MSIGPFGTGSFGTAPLGSTPFFNTSTLIDSILRDTGHATPANETNKRAAVLDFLNNRYQIVATSQHWSWLYQELDTLFKAPYAVGTIDLVNRSQIVAGTGTTFSSNIVPNNVLSIPSRNETYMISSVESNVSLTLEGQYAGPTATDIGYSILQPIYELPQDIESIQSILVDDVGELVPLGRQEFHRMKRAFPGQTGMPRFFTELGRRPEDNATYIEVYPAPDKDYTARLHYGLNLTKLYDSTDSYSLVPDKYRHVLYYGALADMYGYLRDATMSQKNEDMFTAALLNMRNDKHLTDSKIQFQPARNYRNRSTRRKSGLRLSYSASDFGKDG